LNYTSIGDIKVASTLRGYYQKYRSVIQLNKNMIISGAAGFLISAVAAEVYSRYTQNDLVNTIAIVLTGYAASTIVFGILFHIDNKRMYTDKHTGKIDFGILKQILKKMIVAGFVFDIVNNSSRFIILYQLLIINVDYAEASILSSLLASGLSYIAMNLVLKRTGAFHTMNNKEYYLKK
jgi:hypothetical protein